MRTSLAALSMIWVALVLIACGGNGQAFLSGGVCGDGASANAAVANKIGSCASVNSGFAGGFSPCFDVGACEDNIKACTAADRGVFEAVASCQNTYAQNAACSFGAWTVYTACAQSATVAPDGGNALTPACAAAFDANPGVCAIPDGGT